MTANRKGRPITVTAPPPAPARPDTTYAQELGEALVKVDVAGVVARLEREALAGSMEAARLLLDLIRGGGAKP